MKIEQCAICQSKTNEATDLDDWLLMRGKDRLVFVCLNCVRRIIRAIAKKPSPEEGK